jgi:hypothetical protein
LNVDVNSFYQEVRVYHHFRSDLPIAWFELAGLHLMSKLKLQSSCELLLNLSKKSKLDSKLAQAASVWNYFR